MKEPATALAERRYDSVHRQGLPQVATGGVMMPRAHHLPALRGFLLACAFGASALSADEAQPAVAPDADTKLRAMSEYLAGLSAVSVAIDTDQEVIDLSGQKLQYSASMRLLLQRPHRLRVERHGAFAESELLFDGTKVQLAVAEPPMVAEVPVQGDIEAAIRALRSETGIDAPAGDLFFTDPYSGLMTDVVAGKDLGTAFVDGVECHHLAFRAEQVDWQIWIKVGDQPLPVKYVITSKWITGAPQFTARLRNWDTAADFTAEAFTLDLPADAVRLEQIPVNAIGELMPGEGQ